MLPKKYTTAIVAKDGKHFQLLQLPEELLQTILGHLEVRDLKKLSLVSKWCRGKATPLIWRDVELVDCRNTHLDDDDDDFYRTSRSGSARGIPAGAKVQGDEHDDSPLIKKLLILATSPWIAASVHTLTHRCHLPPPSIFNELPRTPFSAQTLSCDPRTICLVRLAVRHMTKLNTLRIMFGHPKLTEALLRCCFDVERERETPIKKLWLENVRLNECLELTIPHHKYGLPLKLDFSGVESLRLRRLPLCVTEIKQESRISDRMLYAYSRGGTSTELQNGLGGHYLTTVNSLGAEVITGHEQLDLSLQPGGIEDDLDMPVSRLFRAANTFDDLIYDEIEKEVRLPDELLHTMILAHPERSLASYFENWNNSKLILEGPGADMGRKLFRMAVPTAAESSMHMFKLMAPTLTTLNLDWLLTSPKMRPENPDQLKRMGWYCDLFDLRFPNLRAFQCRNTVVPETAFPPGLYLLDYCHGVGKPYTAEASYTNDVGIQVMLKPLEFMEAHPKLQCLAWPMDRFYAAKQTSSQIRDRVSSVVERLGLSLTDLRVDTLYSGNGEHQSDQSTTRINIGEMKSRRRFIAEFAAKMQVLTSIKIEGGMPRDERRETLRALLRCPLQKIVLIGVCSPLGSTWGTNGRDVASMLGHVNPDEMEFLEAEDTVAIHDIGHRKLEPPAADYEFEPWYGWDGSAPMIHTVASYFSETLTEVKFCGYKGAPLLLSPTPITSPMLAALKHCHNLRSVVLSLWLTTLFEDQLRDTEVISYWLDRRDASSTSLIEICDVDDAAPENPWARELKTKYAPDALAWRVVNWLGPYLSEQAKSRKGGVHVRASFCVGDWGGIFDLECWLGKGSMSSNVCLAYKGPREEHEDERRRTKLDDRRWF